MALDPAFSNLEGWGADPFSNSTPDPWAGLYNMGLQGYDPSVAATGVNDARMQYQPTVDFANSLGVDPTQASQLAQAGVGNLGSLFGGATDTSNRALLPGLSMWNIAQGTGNLNPATQNQISGFVDQGYQEMNARRAQDKANFTKNLGTFASLLGAVTLPGLMNMYPGQTGGMSIFGSDAVGGAAESTGGNWTAGGSQMGDGNWLGDFSDLLGPNVEESVLGSYTGNEWTIPGMGKTPAPSFLENLFANTAYGGDYWSTGLKALASGLTQPTNQQIPGVNMQLGGYNPDLQGLLGAIMEYQGQKDYLSKLEEYKNEAVSRADPYAPYRPQVGQRFTETLMNPFGENSVLMQALQPYRADMEARDAAAGRNSQYGARAVEMGQKGLSLLPQVMQPYGQASGAYSNPAAGSQAVQSAMMPMAMGELAKSGALGYGINSIMGGKQPTSLQQLFGTPQNNSLWNMAGSALGGILRSI